MIVAGKRWIPITKQAAALDISAVAASAVAQLWPHLLASP